MDIGDDALPPYELEEDFVEDAEEEEIQHNEFLLQEEDANDDDKQLPDDDGVKMDRGDDVLLPDELEEDFVEDVEEEEI